MATPTFVNGGEAGSEVEDRYVVGVISSNELEVVENAELNVVLSGTSVWTVDEAFYISSLEISGDAKVVVGDNASLYVASTGETYAAGSVIGADGLIVDDTDNTDDTNNPTDDTTNNNGADNGAATDVTTPAVGVDFALELWYALLAVSAAGGVTLYARRKRKSN